MKSRKEYIDALATHADDMHSLFGVSSMRLFGSVARNEHKDGSDIDVCVDMPPRILKLVGLTTYLETLLGCKVDVIRNHSNMNPYLKEEIEKDGLYIFG